VSSITAATSDAAAAINPYQSPREPNGSASPSPVAADPTSFRGWRKYLAFHLIVVLAAFTLAMEDSGYWRFEIVGIGAFGQLIGLAVFVLVYVGLFQMMFVSPIVILLLFVRTFTLDKRYLIAATLELLLTAAYFVIVLPMCQ
jgi:hypothetical protein